jgi:steroid 5-alpha reductase family enzyme
MNYFLISGSIIFIYFNLWFIISLIKKRNDVADVAWGLGFVVLAWVSLLMSNNFQLRTWLVTLLVSVWGIRLFWHIYSRNKKKSEDPRYAKWRRDWGKWFLLRSYFQIYILQGTLLFLIALPILFINKNSTSTINSLDFLGLIIWIIGFYFEVLGDAQLRNFIKNPANKGKIITSGLWKYSRHPNYFGEVLLWWGIWLIAFSLPNGWFTVIGPITITFLILKVSGVPMLEKQLEKKPGFAEYRKKVSIFLPLPPKK